MKAFVATLCLFALVLGAITCNAIYINRITLSFCEQLDALPDTSDPACIAAAEELCRRWETHGKIAGFSAGYANIDRITEQTILLVSSAKFGDEQQYRTTIALLYDSMEDIRRLERFEL